MKTHQSMLQGILLRITFFSVVAILLVSANSYTQTYNEKSREVLAAIKYRVEERIKAESRIFMLAEENLEIFENEFLKLYTSELSFKEADFWRYFAKDENGAIRMKKQYYNGVYDSDGSYIYAMSGFIGNNQSVGDPDLQRKILLAYKTLAKLGPAWSRQCPNLSASFPENVGILFYPQEPWGLNADANLRMNELSVFKSVMPESNPERKPVWTGLYYDKTAKEWVITYMKPIDYNGKYLISAGHDIYFTSMVDRLTEENSTNTYSFIMRQDGYLIACPNQPQDAQKQIGELSLDKINQPSIVDKYYLIKENMRDHALNEIYILEDEKNDDYLIVGNIAGPQWLYVAVYPKAIIRNAAMEHAVWMFFQGLLIMAVIMVIVYGVFLVKAQKPISSLTKAAQLISFGNYKKVADNQVNLPVEAKDEIGLLSKAFINMASSIETAKNNLEEQVEQRTRELALANQKLNDLSHLDALTGSYNRRAFDRDMNIVFQQAKQGEVFFSIMMLDLDYFKLYNDLYGHQEGDRILIEVANIFRNGLRPEDKLYRYGGEEFVIVFLGANKQEAGQIAEKITAVLSNEKIPHQGNPNGFITISAGIVAYTEDVEQWEEIVEKADKKMYLAKNQGRHRIIL